MDQQKGWVAQAIDSSYRTAADSLLGKRQMEHSDLARHQIYHARYTQHLQRMQDLFV